MKLVHMIWQVQIQINLVVFFAPTDVINEDIMFSMGNLDFSDYIGDPRDQFKTYYRGLRK